MRWLAQVQNVFLIRHPARVVASYARQRTAPTLEDLGFVQQVQLMERVRAPVVIDASDIRANPEKMLQRLCQALEIPWSDAMLHWPAGGHPSDGVWAAHWYKAVHRSTGFGGTEGPLPELRDAHTALAEKAMPYYEAMAALKLT